MNIEVFNMLETQCKADLQKAKLTLEIMGNFPAGIGDHSTEDFYKNANEALTKLAEAEDKLDCLYKNYPKTL